VFLVDENAKNVGEVESRINDLLAAKLLDKRVFAFWMKNLHLCVEFKSSGKNKASGKASSLQCEK